MTSFLFYPSSSFFYESAGKERKGKERRSGKKGPLSLPGIHDKTRNGELVVPPLPCSALPHRGRQKGKEDGRAKGGPFVPAFLLLFHSFLFHCCQKRRSKEKRRREEGFGEGGGTLSFPCLSLPIVPPSFTFILSFSLFFSPSPCPSLSLSTSPSSPSCVFSLIRRRGRKTGKGTLPLPPPVADISYVSESRN